MKSLSASRVAAYRASWPSITTVRTKSSRAVLLIGTFLFRAWEG
jgi:hypothetical protein